MARNSVLKLLITGTLSLTVIEWFLRSKSNCKSFFLVWADIDPSLLQEFLSFRNILQKQKEPNLHIRKTAPSMLVFNLKQLKAIKHQVLNRACYERKSVRITNHEISVLIWIFKTNQRTCCNIVNRWLCPTKFTNQLFIYADCTSAWCFFTMCHYAPIDYQYSILSSKHPLEFFKNSIFSFSFFSLSVGGGGMRRGDKYHSIKYLKQAKSWLN